MRREEEDECWKGAEFSKAILDPPELFQFLSFFTLCRWRGRQKGRGERHEKKGYILDPCQKIRGFFFGQIVDNIHKTSSKRTNYNVHSPKMD